MATKFFMLLIFFLMNTTGPVSAETVRLSTFEGNPFSQMAARIMTEAYRRAGFDTKIVYLPGKRALLASSKGEVDGEVSRIYEIGKLYPSLIRVNMPYMTLKGMVFAINKNVQVKQQADLKKYRIGSLRGAVFSDKLTEGLNVVFANSPTQLLQLLIRDRVDVIITNEIESKVLIADQFPDAGIVALDPPLTETPIYHYIHQDKSYLVGKIDQILKSMTKQGEIVRIRSEFFREHGIKID